MTRSDDIWAVTNGGSPPSCGDRSVAIWQNLCASKFLGAATDGATTVPGCYQAITRVGDAKAFGNFGVGEFERLRGELFAFDNEFYELSADGTVRLANDSDWLNVAFLTFYQPTHNVHVNSTMAYQAPNSKPKEDFQAWMDATLPSKDCFYAMTLTGSFARVVVSAIPEQQPPYPAYSEARKLRKERTVQNDTGQMVAYFTPRYLGAIGVPGYHFHYLNDTRTVGGHVESFVVVNATLELQSIDAIYLGFPRFLNETLSPK